jgi:ElaB/YqjD/DUF883 family membrane-anchored ribosome-binding protein
MLSKKNSTIDGAVNNLSESANAKASVISTEFKSFLADIEQLITEATSLTGEDLLQAKSKLNDRIDTIKHSFDDMGESIGNKARKSAVVADKYVHEQPWVAIGAGAALGLLIGLLASRRS